MFYKKTASKILLRQPPSIKENTVEIEQSVKQNNDVQLEPDLLLSRLAFSHFIELIHVEDELQRLFYEVETIKNNWRERTEYSETELEQQILNHLQEFLIELGTGFCFEARQKRITIPT